MAAEKGKKKMEGVVILVLLFVVQFVVLVQSCVNEMEWWWIPSFRWTL